MRRASPWWIGYFALILVGIFRAKGLFVPLPLFIIPMLVILFLGIALEDATRKLDKYYEKETKKDEERRKTKS